MIKAIIMLRIICLLFILSFSFHSNAQYDFRSLPHKTDFGTRFHGNTSFTNGTYAAVGIFEDGVNNTSEIILVKWDCMGQIQWAKTLGGATGVNNTNGAIAEAPNGDLVMAYSLATGIFNATMLVARFTQEGDLVWAKQMGVSSEYARGITATNDGGFVVVGSTGTYGVDRLRSDIYAVKLDGDGNMVWNKTYGTNDSYDGAYHVIETSKGELMMSGRYIVDGTFYNFLMRADADGNPLAFKGYGGDQHRNFGYATMELADGNFLNTGYTTLAKENFQSNGDCYLMKVDEDLNQIWAKIYEPQESDRNDFGFSLVLEEDGDYGICLESSSYRAIGGPQAPNKNVIFSTDQSGDLKRVLLFNPKGSQYTKMSKAADGGYFVTGFSTYYISSSTAPFNGFGFKTDSDYSSGDCEEYDRTSQTRTGEFAWDVQDITYESQSGYSAFDYNVVNDITFDSAQIICSRFPMLFVQMLPIPDTICLGESVSLDANPQGGITEYIWDVGTGDTVRGQFTTYQYDTSGTFKIKLIATDGCQTVYDSATITVKTAPSFDVTRQLCPGDSLVYRDSVITEAGVYTFGSSNGGLCDTTVIITVNIAVIDTVEIMRSICPGSSFIYQNDTITEEGTFPFVANGQGGDCDTSISLTVSFMSLDTLQLDTTVCPGVGFVFNQDTFREEGMYTTRVTGQSGECDKIYEVDITVESSDTCLCIGIFPNAFTPNGDNINDTYGMYPDPKMFCEPLNVPNFRMTIFNRWGKKVFESNHVDDKWDGKCDGEDCISEVYLVNYMYETNEGPVHKSVDVTLIR